MLEFLIVTLLPAAVILSIILLLRMRRAIRSFRQTAGQQPDGWRRNPADGHPPDVLWRRAYRG